MLSTLSPEFPLMPVTTRTFAEASPEARTWVAAGFATGTDGVMTGEALRVDASITARDLPCSQTGHAVTTQIRDLRYHAAILKAV
jgi:hypothetical protein